MRADVIMIDDIGLLPVTTDTAEALHRVVDAAYEKRAIALSSNRHSAGFDELMPKTIASATVDRLMPHAHLVLTNGDSISLTQATAGKGVTPLAQPPASARFYWPPPRRTPGHQRATPPAVNTRTQLALDSLDTSDTALTQAAVDSAWRSEIGKQVDEVEMGSVELADVDESHARLRDEMSRRPR